MAVSAPGIVLGQVSARLFTSIVAMEQLLGHDPQLGGAPLPDHVDQIADQALPAAIVGL